MESSFARELHKHTAIPGEAETRTDEMRDGTGRLLVLVKEHRAGGE